MTKRIAPFIASLLFATTFATGCDMLDGFDTVGPDDAGDDMVEGGTGEAEDAGDDEDADADADADGDAGDGGPFDKPDTDDEPADGGEDGPLPGDGSGGEVSACDAYCDTELTCDNYYSSTAECLEACNGSAEGASCGVEFDNMNWCLSDLSCDEFGEFWAGFAALSEGIDPGPFPCINELAEWVVCESEA